MTMETLLPLISLMTLCLSAAGLYLLYQSMVGGNLEEGKTKNLAWIKEKKRRQQKWGLMLLMAGFVGGVLTLFFLN